MGNKSVPERKEGEATTISKADSKKKGISSSKLDSSRKSILIRSDSKRKEPSQKKIEKLFDKYKCVESGVIESDGVMNFINDLQVSLDDVVLVVLAYYLNNKELGRFTYEEWLTGLQKLEMDTLDKIKAGLPALREELKDPDKLSNIYKFSFNFYREDAKNVDLQTADKVFEMLLGDRQHIPQIREFLKEQKSFKNIGKDQWTSIYDFSMQVGPNFEGYDPDDGTYLGPTLLDEFVEWSRNANNQI